MRSCKLLSVFAMALCALAQTFTNPVLWEDLADNEVHRVGDTFYMTASTMHYSPGAPVLRSKDLVNWEYFSHSVPTLDWGTKYNLVDGQRAYIKGIWASSLRHRASNGLWYFVACIEFSKTYIYTASNPAGPWTRAGTIDKCYYDVGLMFDDNDTPYVAYGNTAISVAQLSANGLSEVRSQVVYNTPSNIGTLEGSRMYKRNGNYYIFLTRPADGQYVLKSSSPWGPYTIKVLADKLRLTAVPSAGSPHQGSLVDTPNGNWYYMGFIDGYPGGRFPVLAPITWGSDGFPSLTLVNGQWGNYPYPLAKVDVQSSLGTDSFTGTTLRPEWEWNHNPDTNGFTVNNGLTLRTVTVTSDLYQARNTLSHRIRGPTGTGTVRLNVANMADGDRSGLAALRDQSSLIGVERSGTAYNIILMGGINMNSDWTTSSTGTVVQRQSITLSSSKEIYLRMKADIRPGAAGNAVFSYSTDGQTFTTLGSSFSLHNDWQFFMGYRYGIFNYATKALGGSVRVVSFTSAA
ncbi:glycosyl hydrolase family 43 [Colletotrichum camelliae]|nr:glycosyl hydrolase family 43 [Colletotrichum camelliae]